MGSSQGIAVRGKKTVSQRKLGVSPGFRGEPSAFAPVLLISDRGARRVSCVQARAPESPAGTRARYTTIHGGLLNVYAVVWTDGSHVSIPSLHQMRTLTCTYRSRARVFRFAASFVAQVTRKWTKGLDKEPSNGTPSLTVTRKKKQNRFHGLYVAAFVF